MALSPIDDERQALTPKSPRSTRTPRSPSMDDQDVEYAEPVKNYDDAPSGNKFLNAILNFFIFLRFPKQIWLILTTETAERYAFYGFKTILPLYLKNFLLWNEDQATVIVHAFIFLAYFTPLIGSVMADGLFGKYITVVVLSIIYCIGQAIVALTAIPGVTGTPPKSWGIFIGLALVALGSGGIKPNVSSFGADQFSAKNPAMIASFFAMFYLSVNIGSTFSTVISPIIRTHFSYAVAFAIPAVLMVVATITFAIGCPWYKMKRPKENIVISVFVLLVYSAIFSVRDFFKSLFTEKRIRLRNPLDSARSRCDSQLIADTKIAFRIIFVLLPIPIFFALFDQHASRFVFQANKMNRNFYLFNADADQIQVINPLLIIVLLPIFDRVIYPTIRYFSNIYKLTPLRRIGWGFLFTCISFIFSGAVSFLIEYFGDDRIHVLAQLPQYIFLGIGEILVSVTGQEFAYQQAPPRMKSIMTAFYLLAISMGNVIVLVVAALPIPRFKYKDMTEFLVFAFLMLVALGVFAILALLYKYRDSSNDDAIPEPTKPSLDALADSDNEEEIQI